MSLPCGSSYGDTTDNTRMNAPWSNDLENEFLSRRGYPIQKALPAIFSYDDEGSLMRKDYWETMGELMVENYTGQIDKWCRENNIISTGHLLYEESFRGNLASHADYFGVIKQLGYPGIDTVLTHQHIDEYDFNVAGRLVASVGVLENKERLLCETFTGSGWDMQIRDMKRIAARLLVLGVDYIQYMGAYYSIDGANKNFLMCYPPSHNFNNCLFEFYPELTKFISRLQYLNANTSLKADMAVLFPDSTARLKIGGSHKFIKDELLRYIDNTIQGVINGLLYENIQFIFIDEKRLAEAKCSNGKLVVGGRGQETIF